MLRIACAAGFVCAIAASGLGAERIEPPSHQRPFFMPQQKRQEILALVAQAPWAREEYRRVQTAADQGEGFPAALLYALEGEKKYLEIAQKWLLGQCGRDARETLLQRRLIDEGQFLGPERGHTGPVWYGLEIELYVAYDWLYNGLSPEVRQSLHDGLRTRALYRMEALDHWTTTPNLVFKPITMVAFAGLTLGDDDLLQWGFRRATRQGNYLSMADRMLADGGIWREAPIYAIYHKSLWCMATMSFYRKLYDGKDWFSAKTPGGGSPRGLMDYYLDTSYPIERTGVGRGRIRLATIGDGATSPLGDAFLSHLNDELVLSYAASGDPRYAPFVAMIPDYQPDLWARPALPAAKPALPAAPCRVWPTFGLAMLRSDESPGYWTNPDAIAVPHILSKAYGHEHKDKFHISLFGANRLLYPDFLAIQYERRAMGWTNSTISHNTVVVDEQDTGSAEPAVRCEFSSEVKFLATSAEGVFEGVGQTRALLLTREYLLDLFRASSKVPHVYDYVLHSMGTPRMLGQPEFAPGSGLSPRYWALDNPRSATTSRDWRLEFVARQDPAEKQEKKYHMPEPPLGPEWYRHEAKIRVTAAGDPETQVCLGTWGDGNYRQRTERVYGPAVAERWRMVNPPRLGMLIARRTDRRATTFAVVHEPYANEARPKVTAITTLAESGSAIVVRIDAPDFTDYAAVAFQTDKKLPQVLAAADNPNQVFAFCDYGYLRLPRQGNAVARGGWTGFRVPGTAASLLLNGREITSTAPGHYLIYGELPEKLAPATRPDPECPLRLQTVPAVARLSKSRTNELVLAATNTLDKPVGGRLEFDLPPGVTIRPEQPSFGPIAPGQTARLPLTLAVANDAADGKRTVPVRACYRVSGRDAETRTQYVALRLLVGTVLAPDDCQPKNAFLAIDTPGYSARADMVNSCLVHLADPDGAVRLSGTPLFTFRDEQDKPVVSEDTAVDNFWFDSRSMTPLASTNYIVLFEEDRILAPRWRGRQQLRLKEARFTVPGNWISPGGKPQWKRIVAVDDQGQESEVRSSQDVTMAAAELEFPGGKWNLAFRFTPPLKVSLEGTAMRFTVRLMDETFAIGFCRPGELDEWRRGKR